MGWIRSRWGALSDGREADIFLLENAGGFSLRVSDFGGVVQSLVVPGPTGPVDVVLGFDTSAQYLNNSSYLGCLIGRCANRIGGARFVLDGQEYLLDVNHGAHQLHGGSQGFDSRLWQAQGMSTPDGPGVELRLTSGHLDQGYPGRLEVRVVYTLLADGLRIAYEAITDRPTYVDLTNHSYFNLAGGGDCLGHELTLAASRYLATDPEQIPTGELAQVAGTAMDFLAPAAIGSRIDRDIEPLRIGQGYDHYYVLDRQGAGMADAARVLEPGSGLVMTLRTDCPGFQFYSGNYLPNGLPGRNGAVYGHRAGFCLEAQGYPDAMNHPNFPSPVLRPGETYRRTTEYLFS